MKSVEEVEEILENWGGRDNRGWYFWEYQPLHDRHDFHGIGHVSIIDRDTGGEGDWAKEEFMIFLIEWQDGTSNLYKKTGKYRSFAYDYDDWDYMPFSEVCQVQKMMTVYEEVN